MYEAVLSCTCTNNLCFEQKLKIVILQPLKFTVYCTGLGIVMTEMT